MEMPTEAGRTSAIWPIAAQFVLAVGGLLTLLLAPPANGAMLLIPMTAHAATRLPALALEGDTTLIARGPLPGSLIVRGSRKALAGRLLAAGILPIASEAAGCIDGQASAA
jgi:hypothetical protein